MKIGLLVLAGIAGAWWFAARRQAERKAGQRAPAASAPVAPKVPPQIDTSGGSGSGAAIYTPPEAILGSGFGELSTGAW
jgi:hypothetical protein